MTWIPISPKDQTNDIGLILLGEPSERTAFDLADTPYTDHIEENVYIPGWGEGNGDDAGSLLKFLSTYVYDQAHCEEFFEPNFTLAPYHFCAGDNETPCWGDSGAGVLKLEDKAFDVTALSIV